MTPETQQSGFTPPHLAGSSRKHTNTVAPDTGGAGFTGLGIAPQLLDALDKLKFTTPTPVQKQSIPIGIEGKDLIAIAQTGTGKTLAFGIPVIQRLAQVKGRGLILLPTRELAIQVDESLQAIGRTIGLRTAVLIGGASMHVQRQHLQRKPHVIIATPGRLLDHVEQRMVSLSDIRILILDEADRMLDMGFAPQIKRIFAVLPTERQTMLFSATMPQEIVTIAQKHMKIPLRVEIARAGTAADKVTQEVFFIAKEAKVRLLEALLTQYPGSVLVFTRTKHAARKLAGYVKTMGHAAADIHSDRSLAQRRQALEGFKTGRYRVLVATDIAARGIDVTGIELVVNFDLPMNTQDYVHRIGRTGRAGRSGRAISFATFDQRRDVRDIERLIRTQLPIKPTPELPPARAHEPEMPPDRQQRQPHAWPARRPMAGGRGGGFRGGQRRGRGR
ncbi:MAG: DEAD/DEAH box helicase [Patescibacteria group bacterium]